MVLTATYFERFPCCAYRHGQIWPVYSVMESDGQVRADAVEPDLKQDVALKMYENMVRLETMDDIFYNAQRQARHIFMAQC